MRRSVVDPQTGVWGAAAPQGSQRTAYSMLRNSASGPEIGLPGWILAGLLPGKPRNGPSGPAEGRPESRFRCFPGSSPAKLRPARPISGLEALLRNIE